MFLMRYWSWNLTELDNENDMDGIWRMTGLRPCNGWMDGRKEEVSLLLFLLFMTLNETTFLVLEGFWMRGDVEERREMGVCVRVCVFGVER